MGHNLLELAKQNPEQHIVGVDPFMNGVTSVINTCVQENIKNILIFPHPAQEFLESFKKIFFEKVFILFPDPWPKKKTSQKKIVPGYLC